MLPLPVWVYELVAAPAAIAVCLLHAARALGPARAAGELLALAAYGFALEWVAIEVFGSHDYGPSWRWAPAGVPVAVATVWAAVISSAMALAARRGLRSPGGRAAGAALIAITLDVLIEPVAAGRGLWRWTPPGAWLGVPLGNFVGWAVIVGSYSLGAERWAGSGRPIAEAGRRVLLAGGCILALVAVGLAWRTASLEERLPAGAGWTVWLAVVLGALAFGLRATPHIAGGTLPERLAAAAGPLPGLVLVGLAALFAADAVALGHPALRLVAAGCVLGLAWVARPSLRQASMDRLARVEGLVGILMKPRNQQAWTEEDLAFLRAGLRRLARWTPAFVVFLLPGGMVLLAGYAWFLDRRRAARGASAT